MNLCLLKEKWENTKSILQPFMPQFIYKHYHLVLLHSYYVSADSIDNYT